MVTTKFTGNDPQPSLPPWLSSLMLRRGGNGGYYWFSGPYFKAADYGLSQKVDGLEVLGDLP